MPMIDAFIPEGALAPAAEERLLRELTDILIRNEGFDPANERARAVTWIFLHRPKIFRAGAPADVPIYRIIPTVPEGQYHDAARATLVREVTEAVARAEGAAFDAVRARVWVFPLEIPDGQWGGRGQIVRLPDIMAALEGESSRAKGAGKLAARRRAQAQALLAVARE